MPSESNVPSSEYRPCGHNCAWKFNLLLGDWDALHGCADQNKICNKPSPYYSNQVPTSDRIACTSCFTPEKVVALIQGSVANKLVVRRFVVGLPRFNNPGDVHRFSDVVAAGRAGQILSSTYGWLVRVQHKLDKGQEGYEDSSSAPVVQSESDTTARVIELKLQEGDTGELREYRVRVLRSSPWAVLSTPEWDVLVLPLRF